MKYHPNKILQKVIFRYLSDDEKNALVPKLYNIKNPNSKQYYNILIKNFDINRFRVNPLIWQDIWLYNYIKYEVTDGVWKRGLIAKYEKKVFIFDDDLFWEKKNEINANKKI